MTHLPHKQIDGTLRFAFRIDDSKTQEWLLSVIRDTTVQFKSDSSSPQLVIYDSNYRHNIARDIKSGILNHAKILLCLDEECADSYLDLFHLNVRHIVYPSSPFSADALQRAIFSVNERVSNQEPYTDAKLQMDAVIRTAADYESIPAQISASLHRLGYGHHISNATLVLREALTNAVFHAFRKAGTHARKYTPESFRGFNDNDQVEVKLDASETWVRITVRDNSGSLGPLRVANSMDRHRSDLGILDTRGRGFYLMHHLSHRMVVTIRRGVSTTLELYFLKECPTHYCRHFELIEH